MEKIHLPEQSKEKSVINYQQDVTTFLGEGDLQELVGKENIEQAINDARIRETELKESLTVKTPESKEVSYDKYKKAFSVDGKKVTVGEIVASRHFGTTITLPENIEQTLEGRKLKETYTKHLIQDHLTSKLNKTLAEKLAEKEYRKNMRKSEAYAEIAKREGVASEQLGVIAEYMMKGIGEMIAIDRPDLNIEILPSNAYQDVEEKIDFTVITKQKRRGVEVKSKEGEYEEKTFGIQFTINTAKEAFKIDQITKAKERGLAVDDVLYVSMDQRMLSQAMNTWKETGKSIKGPWEHLPKATKEKTITMLFQQILSEEEQKSILKTLGILN